MHNTLNNVITVSELIQRLQKITNQNKVVHITEDMYYGEFIPICKVTEYIDKVVIE